MYALTICQPYAHLIIHGDPTGELKRVENRTWPPRYRGPLAIHAGKSREWLGADDLADPPDMVFGAVIGVVHLGAVVTLADIHSFRGRGHPYAWLKHHRHVEGPFCLVLENPRPLPEPVPMRGQRRLWKVDAGLLGMGDWNAIR